jgi:5-methylcytosine-specific restriction endonuclease McrA
MRWAPRFQCLKAASVGKKINWRTSRLAEHYLCNSCKKEFPAKMVQVDHIKPLIDPDKGFVNWDTVIDNMFCEKDNLQVLCVDCHKSKSALEKAQAKERKENAK